MGKPRARRASRPTRSRASNKEVAPVQPIGPKLRCWLDHKRNLHLASNPDGATVLVDAVTRLRDAPQPLVVELPLDGTSFPEAKNPVPYYGVERIFATVRLERVDDPTVVQYLYAHKAAPYVAEIRLGAAGLPDFLAACQSMITAGGDFSLGPAKRHRKGSSLDRESLSVWFWGQGNIHRANTF